MPADAAENKLKVAARYFPTALTLLGLVLLWAGLLVHCQALEGVETTSGKDFYVVGYALASVPMSSLSTAFAVSGTVLSLVGPLVFFLLNKASSRWLNLLLCMFFKLACILGVKVWCAKLNRTDNAVKSFFVTTTVIEAVITIATTYLLASINLFSHAKPVLKIIARILVVSGFLAGSAFFYIGAIVGEMNQKGTLWAKALLWFAIAFAAIGLAMGGVSELTALKRIRRKSESIVEVLVERDDGDEEEKQPLRVGDI